MSREQRREKNVLLIVATVCLCAFPVCHLVTLGQRGDDRIDRVQKSRRDGIKHVDDVQQGNWRSAVRVVASVRTSNQRTPEEPRVDPPVSPGEPYDGEHGFGGTDSHSASSGLSWTIGDVSIQPKSSASKHLDGYQADSTGFGGVQGKVLAPSFPSRSHFTYWQAMRPLVQCDDNVMTFTASGEGITHLLVDREGASPISPFQLPSYCGYSVWMSWIGIKMVVPHDACYVTQENGSYVLPMLWLGSRVKLSCPMQMASAPPALPLVLCSPDSMAVQIDGPQSDVLMLGVIVNGSWGPLISEDCADRLSSNPGELSFLISYSAPCITSGDGYHLHLVDDQEYILSCPANPQLPYVPAPPPPSPSNPQFPYIPDPVNTVPTTPPPPTQPPATEQIAQLTEYLQYRYPVYPYPQFPHVYPPGPQPAPPPQPTPGSPPGPQQPQTLYPMEPVKLPHSPGDELKYPPPPSQPPVHALSLPKPNPVQASSPHEGSKLPAGPSQYSSGLYYPYMFFYPAVTPDPTPVAKKTPTTPPSTQLPRPPYLPPSQPELPQSPHFSPDQFYLPSIYGSYYHYGQFPYPNPGLDVQPAATSHATPAPPLPTTIATTRKLVPKQPEDPNYHFGYFDPRRPTYVHPPAPPPPANEKAQEPSKTMTHQSNCLPYPYSYYPYFHPLYPPHYPQFPLVPQYTQTQPPAITKKSLTPPTTTTTTTTSTTTTPTTSTTTTPTTSTTTTPTTSTTTTPTTTSSTASIPTDRRPQNPHLQCLVGKMVAFLPFAQPDSIQVRDQMKTWVFPSSVSPPCGYILQTVDDLGVMFHSPLPACHSEQQTPKSISLLLRYWDRSMTQYRTLDLQCPVGTTLETPALVTPTLPVSPTTAKVNVSPPAVLKLKVFCSSHQMTVELPSGLISGIAVKDDKGIKMNIRDAPKHCGYSERKGKDGKIHLRLPLHSRCHMSLQGKMYIITIIYITLRGRRESEVSCPVLTPGSGQDCNLPSEQRLPCGPTSISQPRCLSMGCCFSKQPTACYYPMDECTIDRHFVFTVPASLTEPPLSPALLVSAGNSSCRPENVTSAYALFKIPMDGCGTRRVMVGKTLIYIVEIINKVQAITLNYATITRDSPVRLLVECRYLPSNVLSVSYMVKTPTLGPAVHTQGVFGVQLRIAKDAQYSSYYPQYHQPLQMLLRKLLYLEVRLLNTPDSSLVLLVHFCVAYPRSGTAVWLLLYNGCPNPLDPAPQQAVIFDPQPPSPTAQTRRFTISTFQFLPDGEFKDPEEEIYFMCSTEICSPHDGPCIEGCFGE